jgi:hypothetical protein
LATKKRHECARNSRTAAAHSSSAFCSAYVTSGTSAVLGIFGSDASCAAIASHSSALTPDSKIVNALSRRNQVVSAAVIRAKSVVTRVRSDATC